MFTQINTAKRILKFSDISGIEKRMIFNKLIPNI
jgi:hypothetical protein